MSDSPDGPEAGSFPAARSNGHKPDLEARPEAWPPAPRIEPTTEATAQPARFQPYSFLARAAQVLILLNALANFAFFAAEATNERPAALAPGALLDMISSVGATVVYLAWCYRVYANLPALGAKELKTTASWAVGYYFVPVLAFYKPYQLLDEAWKASAYGAVAKGWPYPEYQGSSLGIMPYWWCLWVVWNVGDWIARAGFSHEPGSPDAIHTRLVFAGIGVVCGILAVFVIECVTRRQEATARRKLDEAYSQ